jgi:hypothetical protein
MARLTTTAVLALVAAGLAGCKEREPKVAEPPAATPPPLSPAKARVRFCETVFPARMVEAETGLMALVAEPATRTPQGVGSCRQRGATASGPEISLTVDCRIDHPDLAMLRETAAGQGAVREVSIGAGGVHTGDPDQGRYRVAFVLERPSCAVYVATVRLELDRTEALARRVAAALGSARPLP